ncbi:hypothetical protein ABZ235_33700 [Streptomyces canus]
MAMRVGIDGFGRIGPTCPRAALDRAEAGMQDAHMIASPPAGARSSP